MEKKIQNTDYFPKKKIGFFNRLKMAIFNLEDYGEFLGERTSKAFKFFALLILLISVVLTISYTYIFSHQVNKAFSYIKNELPDFTYSNGILKFNYNIEAYDEQYKFKLFVNTDENVNEETLKQYENSIYDVDSGMIFLKDKCIYIEANTKIESKYIDWINAEEGLNISNKDDLVNIINGVGTNTLPIIIFIIALIQNYTINFIQMLTYIIIVVAFGYVASLFCGVRFKFKSLFTLAIYASTLSIVLAGIYFEVALLTKFNIKYFEMVYLLISYIYMIAAILMIKYDLIRQNEELRKIIEVQKEVKEETNTEEKDKKQDDKKNDKKPNEKEDEKDEEAPGIEQKNEPDGSEI